MANASASPVIRLRGIRHNNLKGFDLDLPQNRLIVITGLSGSGKSSLAFDTLFAEGQRRYIETFSPYARQFFDRMDKPRVDRIEGIPPAIAIEQRNAVRTTRSTVGTMTEICDYLKVLWPHLAQIHCRGCDRPVSQDSPQAIWKQLSAEGEMRNADCLITFDVPLSAKLSLAESLALVAKQGYQRLLNNGEIVRVDEVSAHPALRVPRSALTVVQDRLQLAPANRARFIEACEQAYHFGKGRLAIRRLASPGIPRLFSKHLHCADCDLEYREPTPALFSYNHPLGACPACKGFGRTISIDYSLALPDRSLSLAAGAVKPWRSGFSADCQADLTKFCRARGVPMKVPFRDLPDEQQRWIIEGDPDYGVDEEHQWPRAWYGIKGYFRWLESKAYKMHVRVLLSRYRTYTTCPECGGRRLKPEALLYRLPLAKSELRSLKSEITLADFYALSIGDAFQLVDELRQQRLQGAPEKSVAASRDPVALALDEVRARLGYLVEVGLGYLTLDRPTRTLSGGETERVNLTTCLGSRLVNTLFVLDEPSVGLHARDIARLVKILERLRDAQNTVVVVEHEASVIRAADQIVDLGPGHGETGGQLVFQGTCAELRRCRASLTGQYLSGRKRIKIPARRPVQAVPASGIRHPASWLTLARVTRHNLRDLAVEIPLGRFVCVTGVSGSGKSTLIREVLFPELQGRLGSEAPSAPAAERLADANDSADETTPPESSSDHCELLGSDALSRVVMVDQAPLGRTPRSNPAVYLGAFEDIRDLFAASEAARQRGLNASAFSFNSARGQCERCRGAGFEKIEMQFLSDVFIRCPDCDGRRYREHILEVKIQKPGDGIPKRADKRPKPGARNPGSKTGHPAPEPGWSIADVLDATADEAHAWLGGFGDSRPARQAAAKLQLLLDVGLGYVRLGQPINTLSGGESQRLKLAAHLAENLEQVKNQKSKAGTPASGTRQLPGTTSRKPTLFLFDEPTTGLHFEDVRVLLQVFQRLVDAGHSVIVVEHNLDVIKSVDWVIDLGPEAGAAGGRLVVAGTPEAVAACPDSHTGEALRDELGSS